MKLSSALLALYLCLAVSGGCSQEASHDDHDHPAGEHAQGAVPGSHEDWCGEHAVPESKCSRCDPSLVAAFKATGDWCAEHGLPESQCLQCNPDLKIVRPPEGG
jgi:hypothetical protein